MEHLGGKNVTILQETYAIRERGTPRRYEIQRVRHRRLKM